MSYITIAQLEARLGTPLYARLTDRAVGATADANVAQQIVDEAEALANSYLGRRFVTPIDLGARPELSNVLEARVLDLAEYAAWKGSPFVGQIPGRVESIHVAATAWFERIATGEIALPASSSPASRNAVGGEVYFDSRERGFTAEELDGL
ncbi:MAG: DUF1320 family protein [Phycisphaerales bacterium]|nr:DUF1320 family protein [Phycisphaerales bacterium]